MSLRGVAATMLLVAVALGPSNAAAAPRTVVVLLFDGFAPSLLDDGTPTPALARMRREGSWTHRFVPPLPSVSLIGGVTISTGCWPARHGIVGNVFQDPVRGRYDHDVDADWLSGCEHLHQAAERQGVRAAAVDWYGAMSGTRGKQASYATARVRDALPDDLEKADEVVDLLRRPDGERPRLVAAYFRGPDWASHFSGLDAEETKAAVARSDAAIGRILDTVAAAPYPATVLVTTDHGMREVTYVVNARRILANHGIDAVVESSGTTAFVYLRDPATAEDAQRALAAYTQFEVLRKDALPPYARLGDGPRVPPLIISARPPYFIEDPRLWPWWLAWLGDWGPEFLWARLSLKASHGYPPDTPGMHGILYAWGDGIAAGREVGAIDAVDVHPTAMHLLGIAPGEPADGTVARALLAD